MGVCSSCCGRRRSDSEERERLLRKGPVSTPRSSLDKLVDAVGALEAGKYPSQDQLARALQAALKSPILRDDPAADTAYGTGPLSNAGRRLVDDSRELVQSVLHFGIEKNHDDALQNLLYNASHMQPVPVRIHADAAVSVVRQVESKAPAPPSAAELAKDATLLSQSFKTLLQLLITSAAFRLILTDILTTTRAILARVASEVSTVAQQVQVVADDVEKVATLDAITAEGLKGKAVETADDVQTIRNDANDAWNQLQTQSEDETKEVIISRIQAIITEAHSKPEYISALRTILFIFRRYTDKLSKTFTAVGESTGGVAPPPLLVEVDADEHLTAALMNVKLLLERTASHHSLDPALRALAGTVIYALKPSTDHQVPTQLASYLAAVSTFFDRALQTPTFVASRLGSRTAEELYDAGRSLANSDVEWSDHIHELTTECDSVLSGLQADKTSRRLINAINTTQADLKSFAISGISAGLHARQHWREQLIKDTLGWVLPRILAGLKTFPMPRLEFQNSILDAALDALFLTGGAGVGASFMPDKVVVKSFNELTIDMVDSAQTDSISRLFVHMDGIRMSANGIGYYFKYKGSVIGYDDQGVLSLNVGSGTQYSSLAPGTGLSVDIELETSTSDRQSPSEPFFRVSDVRVAVPGLAVSIDESKHWILNKTLIQPLSSPIASRLLRSVLEQHITTGLEAAERLLTQVVTKANTNTTDPGLGDYWNAFVEAAPNLFTSGEESDEEDDASAEDTAMVTSHTTVTLKGIVHTTTVTQDADATESTAVEETTMAIGGGAQLFPDKAGPYESGETAEVTATQVAREAVDDLQATVEQVADSSKEIVDAAVDTAVATRENIERAEERRLERKTVEKKRRGWRTRAFDYE